MDCPMCTGHWLARRRTHCSRELLGTLRLKFSGLSGVHQTVRWASNARANGRQRDQRAISGRRVACANDHQAAPDCPGGGNGQIRQRRKEIVYCSCPVRPRTEDNYCLPNGAPTPPSCLGAIKGTPRRMKQNTKYLLNILRRWDLSFAHLIHWVRDLSTFLSCNSTMLLSCARSRRVRISVVTLALVCVCVAILALLPCSFEIFCVRVRGSNLWRFLTKGINLR
jgi:hypothetical protein